MRTSLVDARRGRDNRTTNPTRYNKSKYTPAQIDAKYVALGI